MQYEAIVLAISNKYEDQYTVSINGCNIKCFCYPKEVCGMIQDEKWLVDLDVLEIVSIEEYFSGEKKIITSECCFETTLIGIYNAERHSIDIGFEFFLESDLLYDYGYLHNKFVKIIIDRIDIEFIKKCE